MNPAPAAGATRCRSVNRIQGAGSGFEVVLLHFPLFLAGFVHREADLRAMLQVCLSNLSVVLAYAGKNGYLDATPNWSNPTLGTCPLCSGLGTS